MNRMPPAGGRAPARFRGRGGPGRSGAGPPRRPGRPAAAAGESGFALPAVLGVLIVILLLGTASFEASRLEWLAARGLSASVHSFYGAESGLAALAAGATAGLDTALVPGIRITMRRTTLVGLEDGSRVVLLAAEAGGRERGSADFALRRLSRLVLETNAAVLPFAGAWRETFRP